LADEEVLREGVVVETVAAAEHAPRLSRQIPRERRARRKVVPVLVVQLRDRRDLLRRRVEHAEAILPFADDAVVVPPEAPVERDVRLRPERFLSVERRVVLGREPPRVPSRLAAAGDAPRNEVVEAVEVETAAVARVEEAVDRRAPEL